MRGLAMTMYMYIIFFFHEPIMLSEFPILYFLEFFPQVLLISEYANMQYNLRMGTINHYTYTQHTVLLAYLARTNVKSALNRDNLT